MLTSAGAWRLHVGKEIVLRDPNGGEVSLPYAHLYRALRLIAIGDDHSIAREELGRQLWGGSSPERQRRSVRQAIHRIRSAIGPHMIVADRRTCRLSAEMVVTFDPDWTGQDPASSSESDRSETERLLPISGFLELLRWLSRTDLVEMYDLMRSNPHLCFGLNSKDLGYLIESRPGPANHNPMVRGWKLFWNGYRQIAGDLRKAKQTLRLAMQAGVESSDQVLVAESIHWLSVVTVLAGDFRSARNLATYGRDLETTLKSRELVSRLRLARGNVLLHEGRSDEAISAYAAANSLEQRRLHYAHTEGLLAFFEVCAGNVTAATNRLEVGRQMAIETGHVGLQGLSILADGYLALQVREWDLARKQFEKIYLSGGHFGIYAREGDACALTHLRRPKEAEEQLLAAQAERKTIQMVYTRWDRSRLGFASSSAMRLAE